MRRKALGVSLVCAAAIVPDIGAAQSYPDPVRVTIGKELLELSRLTREEAEEERRRADRETRELADEVLAEIRKYFTVADNESPEYRERIRSILLDFSQSETLLASAPVRENKRYVRISIGAGHIVSDLPLFLSYASPEGFGEEAYLEHYLRSEAEYVNGAPARWFRASRLQNLVSRSRQRVPEEAGRRRDQLSRAILRMVILHEACHHLLGHSPRPAGLSDQDSRRQELSADQCAAQRAAAFDIAPALGLTGGLLHDALARKQGGSHPPLSERHRALSAMDEEFVRRTARNRGIVEAVDIEREVNRHRREAASLIRAIKDAQP